MAVYPTTEVDVAILAQEIIDGATTHATIFPNVDVTALRGALTSFEAISKVARESRAVAKKDTETKNNTLAQLNMQVKKALKAAESDCIANPANLAYIGWGPKSPATPIVAPGTPTNLRSSNQGAGSLTLTWDKPKSGGSVRNYSLYRTTVDPEQGLAKWTLVDFFYETEVTIENQPRGQQLYYMVNAVNAGGTSPNSNTLPVVL